MNNTKMTAKTPLVPQLDGELSVPNHNAPAPKLSVFGEIAEQDMGIGLAAKMAGEILDESVEAGRFLSSPPERRTCEAEPRSTHSKETL